MLLARHRTGIIAVAVLGAVVGGVQAAAFETIAGSTPAAHAAFAAQMDVLGRQITYLVPIPFRVDTLAGYVQWRGLGMMPLILAFWAVLSAGGGTRGDEERGLVEAWLATGVSKTRLLATRLGVFTGAALIVLAVTALVTGFSIAVSDTFSAGGLALLMVTFAAITVWCYAFTALVAQVVQPARRATAVAGVILLALNLVNGMGRSGGALESWRWISPFYYVDRTTSLAPGGVFDGWGTLGLALSALVLGALAVLAFRARDLGSTLLRGGGRTRAAVRTFDEHAVLRVPAVADLYEQRWGVAAWSLGLLLLCAFMASLVTPLIDAVRGVPGFSGWLELFQHGSNANQAVFGAVVFPMLQLLLAIYAVTVVARWSSDDSEGRLELLLATPIERWMVVVRRAGTLVMAMALIITASILGGGVVASAQGLGVSTGGMIEAGVMLLPFGLAFGAVGAFLSGIWPRAAVVVLSALAAASYLLEEFGPLFRWPSWTARVSP